MDQQNCFVVCKSELGAEEPAANNDFCQDVKDFSLVNDFFPEPEILSENAGACLVPGSQARGFKEKPDSDEDYMPHRKKSDFQLATGRTSTRQNELLQNKVPNALGSIEAAVGCEMEVIVKNELIPEDENWCDPLGYAAADMSYMFETEIKEEPCDDLEFTDIRNPFDYEVNTSSDPLTQAATKKLQIELDNADDTLLAVMKPTKKRKRHVNPATTHNDCNVPDDGKAYKTSPEGRQSKAVQQRERRSRESPEETETRRMRQRIKQMKNRLLEQLLMSEETLQQRKERNRETARRRRAELHAKETSEEKTRRKRHEAEVIRLSRERIKAVETPEEYAARKARDAAYVKNRRTHETPEGREKRKPKGRLDKSDEKALTEKSLLRKAMTTLEQRESNSECSSEMSVMLDL